MAAKDEKTVGWDGGEQKEGAGQMWEEKGHMFRNGHKK